MRKKSPLAKLALFIVAILVLFFILEFGYRIRIRKQLAVIEAQEIADIDCSYRVCSTMHVAFDDKYGEHPKPNDSCFFTAVNDGIVVGGTEVFKSNKDGLDGITTLEQYKKADIKILAFGDSFVHWNQKGYTWPDLLQKNLGISTKKSVAILNYGRGGYGFVQMLDLAADKINELHPDLVIFGMIASSLENDRWWCKEVTENGYTRWAICAKKDNFNNLLNTSDMAQVTLGTTPEWCKRQIAKPDSTDPVLMRANEQCMNMATQIIKAKFYVPLDKWNHSYLLSRMFGVSAIKIQAPFLPMIKYNDYTKDPKATSDAARIIASKTPIALVYMPSMNQIKNPDKDMLRRRSHVLMSSAEKLLKTPFFFLQKGYKCKLPAVIDLQPLDGHPNYDGLQFYADALTPMILSKLNK